MDIATTGQLNNLITFNKKQTTKVNGVAKTDSVEVATVWAKIWAQSIKDKIANIGNGTANTVTFIIRANQSFDITNDMTISYGGLVYQIKSASPDINRQWMTVVCEVDGL
jgi:SPP1 family predicted phage head-tail adaptor